MDRREVEIHGRKLSYRVGGTGPLILLVHGMGGSASTWKHVMPALGDYFRVIAPDLPGHGRSEDPGDDYSLGAFASTLRDLMVALGHTCATVVGHSLGGGVAMQFAYQHPEFCQRLVLVGSGGLGREVSTMLRMLSLPGAEVALLMACARQVRGMLETVGRWTIRAKIENRPRTLELWRSYTSLGEDGTRRAFLRTLRAVVNSRGQAVSAANRLHIAGEFPTLIIWGRDDGIIPVEHAFAAHEAIPKSWLEVVAGVGHYPHCEAPGRFVEILIEFIESTRPAQIQLTRRHVVKQGGSPGLVGIGPSSFRQMMVGFGAGNDFESRDQPPSR